MKRLDDLLTDMVESLSIAHVRAKVVRRGKRDPIPTWVRSAIRERDGHACLFCRHRHKLVLDHIVPWSAGGSDDPTNLRLLCWWCNEDRSNRRYVDLTPRPPLVFVCARCDEATADADDLHSAYCVGCHRLSRSDDDAIRYYRAQIAEATS